MRALLIGLLSGTLAISAFAQPAPGDGAPPPPPEQAGGPAGDQPDGPPGGPGGQGRGGQGRGDQGQRGQRPDGPGNGGPNGGPNGGGGMGQNRPNAPRPNDPLDRMRNYLDIVDRYSKITQNATTAGVAAVIGAADILRPAGNQATIDFFVKQLETTKNETVKRAIRLQLVDLYRLVGDREKALQQLTILMNEAPAADATTH